MTQNTSSSFLARMRQKFFDWRLNHEIFDRIMPHLQKERDHGYAFGSEDEMDAQTETMGAQALLDRIEQQARSMPKGYRKAFRYVLHRDLTARLRSFEQAGQRRVKRTCNPRFVARHA